MIENSVVLPAPFGPISAVIRPASAASDALIDGKQPAEALGDVFDAEQRLSHGAAPPRCSARPSDAATRGSAKMPAMPRGANATTRIEHAAVDDEIEARRVAGHELGQLAQRLDHQRAEQRTEHRADAADDRREQRLDRDPRAVGDAGIDEEEILRIEAAARRRDRGRERHGAELDHGGVDAERAWRRPRSRARRRDRRRSGCPRSGARGPARQRPARE